MQGTLRLVEFSLGASLVLLAICWGLWQESTAPSLPGAAPASTFHTVVADLGYPAGNRNRVTLGHIESIESSDAPLGLMGTLASRRTIQWGDSTREIRVDFVFGDLLRSLRVPISGRPLSARAVSMPLAVQPVREAVISAVLARQLFGSSEAALGQTLRIATMGWMISGEGWASFQIVGVSDPAFLGTNIESHTQIWVGINGWSDVVFPHQQGEDFRRHFGATTLALDAPNAQAVAGRLSEALRRLGEPQVRIQLARGAGYHPMRRARFEQISRSLMLGVGALTGMLAVCVFAFLLLAAQRSTHDERIRRMLGESDAQRTKRQLRSSAASLLRVGLASMLLVGLAQLFDTPEIPLERAALRGIAEPVVWGVLVALFAAMFIAPPWLSATLVREKNANRRFGSTAVGLFVVLLTSVLLAWFQGGLSMQQLLATLSPNLPQRTQHLTVVELESRDRGWMFDPSDIRSMESGLTAHDVALASTGPLGNVIVSERGVVESAQGQRSAVIPINHVSRNYFSVVGIDVRSQCGPISEWPADAVYANERFLAAYGSAAAAGDHRIRLRDGRVFRICGAVSDAHMSNARAGLSAMVYAPLRERRFLAVAVMNEEGLDAANAALDHALSLHLPDTRQGAASRVDLAIQGQLAQERAIVGLNAVMMALTALLCFMASLMLGRAVARMNRVSLATRRALGASRLHLASLGLLGRRRWPWVIALFVSALALPISHRLVTQGQGDWWAPLGAALLIAAALVVIIGTVLMRSLSDASLLHALKSDDGHWSS